MPYEAKIQVGQYWLNDETWLDIRLTDMGVCVSVCDQELNLRYTALVDNGELVLGEVKELISEEDRGLMFDGMKAETSYEIPPPVEEDEGI